MKKADEILKKYEDLNEHHFYEVDRNWIIVAMEEYKNIPLNKPVIQAKAIKWKEERWVTDGYVGKIKLFSIAYEGITHREKNRYNLTSRLPQLMSVEVDSEEEGKQKAQELLTRYIKLLLV